MSKCKKVIGSYPICNTASLNVYEIDATAAHLFHSPMQCVWTKESLLYPLLCVAKKG